MRGLWVRWIFLIMGGALLTPYVLLGMFLSTLVMKLPSDGLLLLGVQLLILLGSVPAIMVTAFLPAVRVLEGGAAHALLDGPPHVGPPRGWGDRWRTACWFALHLVLGGIVSALTLSVPPAAAVLIGVPLIPGNADTFAVFGYRQQDWGSGTAPLAGVGALVVLVGLVVGVGALMARLAPVLLGPSAADRLAAAEERARRLAERNRLARDLHDSVGHALSVVTLQAGAAGRVLDDDPAFARRALTAIEESARAALADLDHVLGLLREESDGPAPTAPTPTLAALPDLVDRTRAGGVEVRAESTGDLAALPTVVSQAGYRIIQESLTNALRHAGPVPVTVRVHAAPDELEITVTNPFTGPAAPRGGGGRGLPGIAERVRALGGTATIGPAATDPASGPADTGRRSGPASDPADTRRRTGAASAASGAGVWRVDVRLPR
ncbi:histidine kinase [Longispora sp. K20-0274]|uniref:sensor histidine kinase n=1 Tax=Longispora sp. K20-0274 TaxID=3088255 RepID=UPI003999598E